MPKADREKLMAAEHVLEVRHDASGAFLDLRGYIADYIQKAGVFNHWKIDTNVVNFRDDEERLKAEGAFVGYKSAGYVVLDSPTRNYFPERASSFWRTLVNNGRYTLPPLLRFGARTKAFVPSSLTFDQINKKLFEGFFAEPTWTLIGGQQKDLQFTIEFLEREFEARLTAGPIHENEASQYFAFESEHFKKPGLFLDLDYYKTKKITVEQVPMLLSSAAKLTWTKIEGIADTLGL
jgi:hypothetical protein